MVLVGVNSTIDVEGFYSEPRRRISRPPLKIDSHLSDVKDLNHVRYDPSRIEELKQLVLDKYLSMIDDIELAYLRGNLPQKAELDAEITWLSEIFREDKQLLKAEERHFRKCIEPDLDS